jgi:hypothetical protein
MRTAVIAVKVEDDATAEDALKQAVLGLMEEFAAIITEKVILGAIQQKCGEKESGREH